MKTKFEVVLCSSNVIVAFSHGNGFFLENSFVFCDTSLSCDRSRKYTCRRRNELPLQKGQC